MATPLSKGITGEYAQGENYTVSGNDNWRLLNAYALDQWANDPTTTTGLTYGYRGGLSDDNTVLVAGTIALSDDTINYVERTSLGTVSKNVIGFTAGLVAMARVTTDLGAITLLEDCRRQGSAPLAGPVFTGIPTVPTAALGDNSPQIANTGFVQANAVPQTLVDTKGDLLVAIGDNQVGKLAVGANGKFVKADSTQTTGLAWGDAVSPTLVDAKGDLLAGTANDTIARLAVGTDGFALVANSGQTSGLIWQARDVAIPIIVGDAVSVVPTGFKLYVEVPFACTIIAWRILADVSGSIVFDIWKDTYANAPPTAIDTITAAAKPTLSSAQKAEQTSLGTWTTAIAAGDWLGFNVDSASTVKLVTLSLTLRRS